MTEEFNDKDNYHTPTQEEKGKLLYFFSPSRAALLSLFLVFVLYQFGGAVLTLLIFGLDFENADVNAVRLLTTGGQILFILLPALLFAKFVYHDVTSALRIKIPRLKEIGVFIFGLFILTPLLQSFLYIQNYLFTLLADKFQFADSVRTLLNELDKMVESAYGNLLNTSSVFETSFIIFVVAVVPAVCEEMFFRGFVQKSFEQKFKPFAAIFVTASFFGIYHFNPYGLISLIALGIYFGYAAYKSDSIIVPAVLHFLNNFFAVMAFVIIGDEELVSSSATQNENILPFVIGFVILSFLFFAFIVFVKKNYKYIKGGGDDLPKL
jgi:membrane protease YdiL (CAAX protease family)